MALVHKLGWDPKFMARSGWFWPLARAARRFERSPDWPTLADYAALHAELAAGSSVPLLRFGENVRKQDKRCDGRVVLSALYDGRIVTQGEVPTRERDWHDFFNVLCFATFPRIKHALHTRQYRALKQRVPEDAAKLPGARSPEQDALTLFDEGGVILVARETVAKELARTPEGPRAFEHMVSFEQSVEAAVSGGDALIVPFGHALFEHLVEGLTMPNSRICMLPMKAWPAEADAFVSEVDARFAEVVRHPEHFRTPKEQLPLRLSVLEPRGV